MKLVVAIAVMSQTALAFAQGADVSTHCDVTSTSCNVMLLSERSPITDPNNTYSDVWGFTQGVEDCDPSTPAPREYALLLSKLGGTHIFDCTDPMNPVELPSSPIPSAAATTPCTPPMPASNETWRDVKMYQSYAFVVSEAHCGLQIIDLTDPLVPTVMHWAQGWNQAHNLTIDEERGLAYVMGPDQGLAGGMHVVDITTPTSPVLCHTFVDTYIHDGVAHRAEPRGGAPTPPSVFYGSAFVDGSHVFLDVSPLAPCGSPCSGPLCHLLCSACFQLSCTTNVNCLQRLEDEDMAHSVWPTRDGTHAVIANESLGGVIKLFNVETPGLEVHVSTYKVTPPTGSPFPHHANLRDRVAHISYLTEGYRVVDFFASNPALELGFYDTYSGPSVGLNHGAWGVYHQQPSGVIYVSDWDRGLLVLQPKASAKRCGMSTPTTGGAEIYAVGAAYIGNPAFALEAEKAPPTSGAVLMLGANCESPCTNIIAMPEPHVVAAVVVTDASGYVNVPFPIPATPALNDQNFGAQFLFVEPSGGITATRGLEITTFEL
ncbi:MAG: hypothetical protein AAF628_15995 [Planctomycetota bacterium]